MVPCCFYVIMKYVYFIDFLFRIIHYMLSHTNLCVIINPAVCLIPLCLAGILEYSMMEKERIKCFYE